MRVGIVGYGNLGKFLVDLILRNGSKHGLELDFIWNRTYTKFDESIPKELILTDLKNVVSRSVDLIVEVAHPGISKEYGSLFLTVADYFVGSPTAFADPQVNMSLREAALRHQHAVYIPSGAFWGAQDIQKMANMESLHGLTVTMKKHPSSFRLEGKLKAVNDKLLQDSPATAAVTLYDGPVKELCSLAPNNVNTMAAAAIAAHNLGFDKVIGRLVADPSLKHWHVVEVDVTGNTTADGNTFSIKSVRKNPAAPGAVTGSATFHSFWNSLLLARRQGPGIHLC